MSSRNRVASSARKMAMATAIVILVTAANPSAVAEPFGPKAAEWSVPWSAMWKMLIGLPFGVPSFEHTGAADEVPPPPPPPPPPPIDNQGSGTAGGSSAHSDPDGYL